MLQVLVIVLIIVVICLVIYLFIFYPISNLKVTPNIWDSFQVLDAKETRIH